MLPLIHYPKTHCSILLSEPPEPEAGIPAFPLVRNLDFSNLP
jgi:hypothetical protein